MVFVFVLNYLYNCEMSTVGNRVKSAREKSGITQGELAKRVNASQQMISELERGNVENSRKLVLIASVLNVSANWLATGISEDTESPSTDSAVKANFGTERPRLVISDSAMAPRFSIGDTVYYSSSKTADPGNFVIVKINGKATLRKYRVVNKNQELVPVLTPLSEDFPEIEASQIEILGVAEEHVISLTA